jgi:hypothetical protein
MQNEVNVKRPKKLQWGTIREIKTKHTGIRDSSLTEDNVQARKKGLKTKDGT